MLSIIKGLLKIFMIPTSLKLEQIQLTKLKRFIEFLKKTIKNLQEQEDISPLNFLLTSTGIGDIITVNYCGYICDLTIFDDGTVSKDKWMEEFLDRSSWEIWKNYVNKDNNVISIGVDKEKENILINVKNKVDLYPENFNGFKVITYVTTTI